MAAQDLVDELDARGLAGYALPVTPEVISANVVFAAEGALNSRRDVKSAELVSQAVDLLRSRAQLNSRNRLAQLVHSRVFLTDAPQLTWTLNYHL